MSSKAEADQEAFRTAIGMAHAVLRRDTEGLQELWYFADEPDRVAHWMAAITAVAARAAGKHAGIDGNQWLAQQVEEYEARKRGPEPD